MIKVQRGIAIIPSGETTVIVKLEHEVNPKKTIVVHGGSVSGYGRNNGYSFGWDSRLVLLNSKQLEIKRAWGGPFEAEVSWQVVEFI